MISSLWPPVIRGGAEKYAAELADRLRQRSHEVEAVTFGIDGPDVAGTVRAWPYRVEDYAGQGLPRRLIFHGLDVYRPATSRVIRDAIQRFSPDVVHSHFVTGLSSAALSEPGRNRIPHVHSLHGYWLLCQRTSLCRRDGTNCDVRCAGCRAVSSVRNAVIRRHPPDVVVAVSQFVADMHADLDWIQGRLRVIHHPVEAQPRQPREPGRPVTFGYLGRLTVEKGVSTLLAAFESLTGDAQLVVAGDGPLLAPLQERADGRVAWRGWISGDALDQFFGEIDCLVVPSEWRDPAPLVVNEARGRGVAVIAARAGGLPELVSPETEELLFPPGDAEALQVSLERFAEAPAAFVESSLQRVMSWDEHLDLVESAFEDAIQSAGRRR